MPPKAAAVAAIGSDAKLDVIMTKLEKLDTLETSLGTTTQLLQDHLARVTAIEGQVATVIANQTETSNHLARHDRDITGLKLISNSNEQLLKSSTMRVLGYPVMESEVAAINDGGFYLRDHLYTRFFKSVFEAAVTAKFIMTIPGPQEAITRIYRSGRTAVGSTPPPIIVCFATPLLRQAILRYKIKAQPVPNTTERAAGAKKIVFVEDLTKANHSMLKSLQSDPRVAKVWSLDGQIRFVKVDDDRVIRVFNVFDSVESLISG